MTKYVGKI